VLDNEFRRPARRRGGAYVSVEIEDLSSLRQQYGRAVGELVLKDVTTALNASMGEADMVGRIDDNRFAVLLLGGTPDESVPRMFKALGPRLAEFAARRDLTMSVQAGSVPLADVPRADNAWSRAAETAIRVS
jgi:GGDEF domain-containing protein